MVCFSLVLEKYWEVRLVPVPLPDICTTAQQGMSNTEKADKHKGTKTAYWRALLLYICLQPPCHGHCCFTNVFLDVMYSKLPSVNAINKCLCSMVAADRGEMYGQGGVYVCWTYIIRLHSLCLHAKQMENVAQFQWKERELAESCTASLGQHLMVESVLFMFFVLPSTNKESKDMDLVIDHRVN